MANIMDIDSILENDLMDALGDMGSSVNISEPVFEDISIKKNAPKEIDLISNEIEENNSYENENEIVNTNSNSNSINLDSSNIDSIASLLKELLNNKTIEITIKIKD